MQLTKAFYLPVPLFTFLAWLLLLLVSVSTPITKSIYLTQVTAAVDVGGIFNLAQAQALVRFGVAGWCSSGIQAEAAGGLVNTKLPPTCSPTHIGYNFDQAVLEQLQLDGAAEDINSAITFGLSTHIVAAVLSFIAFIAALFVIRKSSRAAGFLAVVFTVLALIFAIIAFAFDMAFIKKTRDVFSDDRGGFVDARLDVKTGNGVWMTLVAMLLLFLTSIISCIGCIRISRAQRRDTAAPTEKY